MVSWERGDWPSQPCRKGVTVEAAEDPVEHGGARLRVGPKDVSCSRPDAAVRMATKRLGASKPSVAFSSLAVAKPETSSLAAVGQYVRVSAEWPLISATVGDVAGGNSTVRRKSEACAGHAQLVLTHFVKDARAVAENDGNAGDGVPDDVAEAAQAGEVDVDRVPIGMESNVRRRADDDKALRRLGDGAGVGDIELESCAGSEGRSERNGGLVKLASVVESELSVAMVKATSLPQADALPIERRRNLQRYMASGDLPSLRTVRRARTAIGCSQDARCTSMSNAVKVTARRSASVAVGAATGWPGKLRRGGTDGGRSLAVFVDGAGEDDLAVTVAAAADLRGGADGTLRGRADRGHAQKTH